MASPDGKGSLGDVVAYLRDWCSREDLKMLLTDRGAWKELMADAGLSREEEETLREALIELTADMAVDDTDGHQDDPQDRKMFLDAYPQLKRELEERIEKLRALADKVDQVHRDCTITNVVADSASAASGVLTILGLTLAPVTAGVSLMLSATGMGLGAAAAVTRVTSSIVDHKNRLSAEAEVSRLHSTGNSTVRDMQDAAGQTVPEALFKNGGCARGLKSLAGIGRNIRAIRIAQTNPRLLANAKRLMAAGRLSARNTKQVQKAFGGTALAMTKGARLASGAAAGLFLLMDVASLVKESLHLHEGAKSGSAAELRRQAEELEEKLKELTRIHDSLKG